MSNPLAYVFHQYRLLPAERQLLADGQAVRLGGRAFDTLLVLVQRSGSTVGKEELIDLVWPGRVVEENNLQVQMVALRKLLGHPSIATVPGRGYRFVLPVQVDGGDSAETAGPAPAASAGPGAPRRGNVPSELPPLLGRDEELRDLLALLASHPLVTIAGAGGIGKTRLALAAAAASYDAFSEGVWWVELAALSDRDPAAVALAVARALRLQPAPGSDAAEAVAGALRQGPVLLVLDNAEHLIDGVAALVALVRSSAPHAHVLVTSQEVLRAADEHVMRLTTLALPSCDGLEAALASGAVALFVARAMAADRRFVLNGGNCAEVVEICQRLDGIALAIELAAARLPLLGVTGLRQHLDQRFKLLTGGARAVLRRHQTLRAALEWSHALLSAPEQRVLRRLSVFAGGFSLAMAQQVAEDSAASEESSAGAGGNASAHGGELIDAWDVLEHLGALVDKSLVLVDGDELPRYRLLETTRLFALERLADAGETDALLHRHALAVQAALAFNPGSAQRLENLADWTRLTIEIDNVRAAMDWAASCDDDLLVVDLVGRAGLAFIAAGLRGEFLTRALAFEARVVAAAPSLPPNVVGRYWFRLANVGANVAHPAAAHAALQAARIYRALGQSAVVYEALTYAIGNGTLRGQAEPLRSWVEEAEALEQADWPYSLRANFQWARHRWLLMQGRTEEALQCALKQAELTRQYDSEGFVHIVLGGNVAACELALGRVQQAEARARQALESLETSGKVVLGLGHLLQTLALALVMQGRHSEAAVMIRRAQRHLAREGDDLRLLETAALHAAGQGRMEDAARALGHADAVLRRNGEVRWPAVAARCEGLRVQLSLTFDADMLELLMAQGAALSRDESFNVALRSGVEAVKGSDGLR